MKGRKTTVPVVKFNGSKSPSFFPVGFFFPDYFPEIIYSPKRILWHTNQSLLSLPAIREGPEGKKIKIYNKQLHSDTVFILKMPVVYVVHEV